MATNSKELPPRSAWERLVETIRDDPRWQLGIWIGAFVLIAGGASLVFKGRTSVPAAPPPVHAPEPQVYRPPTTATLRVYLRAFDDRTASLAQLTELAALLPRQQIEAVPGTTVSDLIAQEMRAVHAARPRTLALYSRTMSTEGLESLAVVPRGGRVYFPALPLVRPSWEGDRTVGGSSFRVTDPGGSASFKELIARRLSETESIGTRGHVIDFIIDASSLARPEVQRLLERPDVRLVQSPLRLKFGAASACPAPSAPVLTQAQADGLRQRLAAATRTVDLFILDSGWPEAAYDASRARLFEMLDRVRRMYGLGDVTRVAQPFTSAGYDHADNILRALAPFTALDTTERVRVTYVPMSLAQESKEVLREMLMLSAVIELRAHLLGGRHGPIALSERLLAETFANVNVAGLPPVPGAVTHTDKAIFDALNRIVAEVARDDQTYYIANYSWVVEAGTIVDTPPAVRRGLGVAAAGNANTDVSTQQIDLARRGGEDMHFVTVMNFDETSEPACDSSYLNETILARAGAVGFSGRLGNVSQTSFAAPRVAWLLALAEGARTLDHENLWFQRLQIRLASARTAGTGFKTLKIDPVTLAKIWP